MKTTTSINPNAADIIAQLEAIVGPSRIRAAAMNAHEFLADLLQGSVHYQEEVLSRFTIPFIAQLDLDDDAHLAAGVAAASHIQDMRETQERRTASEHVTAINEHLSALYQADW